MTKIEILQEQITVLRDHLELQSLVNRAQNKHLELLTKFVTKGLWFDDQKGKELVETMEATSLQREMLDEVASEFYVSDHDLKRNS